jgi:hypothetical protein
METGLCSHAESPGFRPGLFGMQGILSAHASGLQAPWASSRLTPRACRHRGHPLGSRLGLPAPTSPERKRRDSGYANDLVFHSIWRPGSAATRSPRASARGFLACRASSRLTPRASAGCRYGWPLAVGVYSTFCSISRSRSMRVFASTTAWAIATSGDLAAIVLASRASSWAKKSSERPGDSSPSNRSN